MKCSDTAPARFSTLRLAAERFPGAGLPAVESCNAGLRSEHRREQVIDVIDVQQLIKNAVANGGAVHNKQGFHVKLQFSQDPHKHKTFWVNCPAPTPPTTSTPPTLALSKTVSPSGSVPVNKLLTYTITLKNLSAVAASNITVDDTMSGTATFTVNDGTNGTTNSFAGNPTVT